MTTLTKAEARQVAETILEQLGGAGRVMAMVGVKNFFMDRDGSLQFKFQGCPKANSVRITLNGRDLYDVVFSKISTRTLEVNKVVEFNDIFCDQLKSTFEEFTGLFLSL